MSYQTVGVSDFTSINKIPEYAREYKREYHFIRGINKEFKYFINRDYDWEGNIKVKECDM